jgi:hypothetical protein
LDSASATVVSPSIADDDERPITFHHNPQIIAERPSSILEVLPEEREMLAKSPESFFKSPQRRKANTPTKNRKSNRSWQVVCTPIKTKFEQSTLQFESGCMIPFDAFSQLIKLFVNRGRQPLPLIPTLMRYSTELAFHYPILTRNRDSEILWRVSVPS